MPVGNGFRSLCFSPKRSSPAHSSPSSRTALSTPRKSFSDSLMERTLEFAELMIEKWNPDDSTFAKVTSLFHENRREAKDLVKCVNDLQKAMQFIAIEDSSSEKLARAQILMQIAMKRLQKEFYQILSMKRAYLDPESVSTQSSRASTRSSTSDYNDNDDKPYDEIVAASSDSISEVAMADLRSIAECMIWSGYGKECVMIYNTIRKSIVDEGIYKLGVEKLSYSQIHKMDWEVLEFKIKNWLDSIKIAVKTLFNGERVLCDHVMAASDSIRESCFTEISKGGAMVLFGFPENVAKSSKKLPEKVFRTLEMYTAISENWPEIESIFAFKSTSIVRSQALSSLIKLSDSVRTMLTEFESVIQKDSSKSPVAGAGVHRLTIQTMSYLTLLADYNNVLADILADSPSQAKSPFSDSDDSPASAISRRFAWFILVLLCKLDTKSKHYKDLSLSYLFLTNNLQHIVSTVRQSNLKCLTGDDWITKHELKVKQFARNYVQLGWDAVVKSLPETPTAAISAEEVKERFRRFNTVLEQAHHKQCTCVVPDSKLRDQIKQAIARKLVPVYKQFYSTHKVMIGRERNLAVVVRFTPADLENYLSDLFSGMVGSGTFSSSSSSSSNSRYH